MNVIQEYELYKFGWGIYPLGDITPYMGSAVCVGRQPLPYYMEQF
jgi:hypothetical protein